jgi:SAM-dependent methyltransferase
MHGDSSKGVGWKNDEAQRVRFAQLLKIIKERSGFSINDLGCGTAKLYDFLHSEGFSPALYYGYDILDEMIGISEARLRSVSKIKLKRIFLAEEMETSDYTVASGIFNVKYQAAEYEWLNYVLSTLECMNLKSIRGFAFNLLTKYSDKEFMQSYLYYADPLYFFDYCKRNLSKDVALLHDYGQFDFTILVRKC